MSEARLQEPYFSQMKNHEKYWELRLLDKKRALWKTGSVLTIRHSEDGTRYFDVLIEEKLQGASFKELLEIIHQRDGIDRALPGINNIADAVHEYCSIISGNGQTYGELENNGVVAIKVSMVE